MMLCVDSVSAVRAPFWALLLTADPVPAAGACASEPGTAAAPWAVLLNTGRPAAVPPLETEVPELAEHAASRRPTPTVKAPAIRSVRSAFWRARARMALSEGFMLF